MRRLVRLTSLLLVGAAACGTKINAPIIDGEGLAVLFIGNSLTYVNSLPAIVAEMAEATGMQRFNYGMVAAPDVNLEDHWRSGTARAAIRSQRWDYVVLQQGPSSLPQNQVHLREWSARFADEIRAAGGRPALYMVWPAEQNQHLFPAVVASYTAAAEAVDGVLLPAGAAWLAAWERDPDIPLYDRDRFHPSETGSYLAALVIYRRLYDNAPLHAVPTRLPRNGITIDSATAAVLRAAVLDVTQ